MISLLAFYLIFSLLFFVYSYGFVDFNLTLSSHPMVMAFVGWAQQLAMFQRGTSLQVYLTLVGLFFGVYAAILLRKQSMFPWKWVIAVAAVFTFSYTLLSSDVFKYLFAARMVVDYHVNPHVVAPNTFPDDTWIRFMRWVHTPSPYGPVMTGLSIVAYVGGLKKFVPALILSKVIALGFYCLAVWLVGELSRNMAHDKKRVVRNQLFFALNPLVLVEWLSNVHNDGPMITLFLLSLYLTVRGRKIGGFIALALSVGVKYVTGVVVPFILIPKKISLRMAIIGSLGAFAVAPLVYHYSYQYQPWYVTWLVPVAAILGNTYIMIGIAAYTLGAFLRYIPFVATGLWQGTALQFALLTFVPLGVSAIVMAGLWWIRRKSVLHI